MDQSLPPPPPPYSPQRPPPQRSSCRVTGWAITCIFLILFLCMSVFMNFAMLGGRSKVRQPESVFQEMAFAGDMESENKIAVIDVKGVISKYTEGYTGRDGMVGDIQQQLKSAVKDPNVKAIIVRIDSPGGEVLASDEIYRAILKAKSEKPVIASMGSVAASGGYYVALGSDLIIADELTITGSIGVIMETLNYKGLMDKVGLQTYVFKSGAFKDLMNGSREPTPEEIELVQALIMETYDKFVGIVAERRKLDLESLKTGLADGRILSGTQAKAGGFVDELGDFDLAVTRAKEKANITDAKVVQYYVPFTFGRLFGFTGKADPTNIKVSLEPGFLKLEQGKLYYLSAHLF